MTVQETDVLVLGSGGAALAAAAGRIPLERVAQPEDLVGPARFRASEGARYVSGQILHVNGGMVMEP